MIRFLEAEDDRPAKRPRMHDLIGHRWPVKVRLARHCAAGRGRQGPRVGGPD